MSKAAIRTTKRINRSICLPFAQDDYDQNIKNTAKFRRYIDNQIQLHPELFPLEITNGYKMKDIYFSKKLKIKIRRIDISGTAYTIRPSYVMPYMTGNTSEIEKALFLRKFGVPYWAISYIFGKNAMNWYRKEQALGRNSIVGTTIINPDNIPKHLAADEKHTKLLGNKIYIATTVGNECILGTEIANEADDEALTRSYNVFKDECQCLKPTYSPETVNIDGWKSTNNAWKFLFRSVIIICCFLHIFIKIRDRGKKKYKELFIQVSSKLWECYRAANKPSFSQRIRRLLEWCNKKEVPDVLQKPIEKLRKNITAYKNVYDHPGVHRTSNMLDRLMQRMDRQLFSAQYFHGSQDTANLSIRGWALIQNFAPSNPRTVKIHNSYQSPAARLNSFQYHNNWLQNLLISASLGGYRKPPQKTL